MEKVTKQAAEEAVANFLKAKQVKKEAEASMKQAEAVVEQFGIEHIGDFIDNRLACGIGIIQIKAGQAKPLKDGKPLSTAGRTELATRLPEAYVKVAPDFLALYNSTDAKVRQQLKAEKIEVVREDKFAIV